MWIIVAAHLQRMQVKSRLYEQYDTQDYLIEMLSQDIPQIGPFKTNPIHVVIRDLDQFLQTEESRVLRET